MAFSLAFAELSLAIAKIFRRFEFELNDTIEERDVLVIGDCNLAMVDYRPVGIRARVVKELKS